MEVSTFWSIHCGYPPGPIKNRPPGEARPNGMVVRPEMSPRLAEGDRGLWSCGWAAVDVFPKKGPGCSKISPTMLSCSRTVCKKYPCFSWMFMIFQGYLARLVPSFGMIVYGMWGRESVGDWWTMDVFDWGCDVNHDGCNIVDMC